MRIDRASRRASMMGLQRVGEAPADPLSQAQALDRLGRSREACLVLERALAGSPGQLEWMRMLAYWLYRDGREKKLLNLLEEGPASWRSDPYLVLQRASCLARLQEFGRAREAYRQVLDLTQDPALRKQATDDLQWLEREEDTQHQVQAGLRRARLGILGGVVVLGGATLFLWLARRREAIAGSPAGYREAPQDDPSKDVQNP